MAGFSCVCQCVHSSFPESPFRLFCDPTESLCRERSATKVLCRTVQVPLPAEVALCVEGLSLIIEYLDLCTDLCWIWFTTRKRKFGKRI